jgi:hypothetical protein
MCKCDANAMQMRIASNFLVRMRCECEFQFALPALLHTPILKPLAQSRQKAPHIAIYYRCADEKYIIEARGELCELCH